MLINGYTLGQYQRCPRPLAISRTHRLTQWRPQSLLAAVLRHGIFNLSNGLGKERAIAIAVNGFLDAAKNPGLDVGGIDTYTLATDYCAIVRNVLEYLSRLTLLTLREITPVNISPNISWQFLSHVDETGALHRWKFVDYIEEDPLAELHSWEVFGDMAAADAPMALHLVAIGQRRGSRQHSPWCKVYAHPKLANIYRFQKKGGDKLTGEWRPKWYADNSDNTPKKWVDAMMVDGVADPLIRHISVKELGPDHIEMWAKDVKAEGSRMLVDKNAEPRSLAMRRYACDHPYACPHQFFCYGTHTLDDVGIYTRRSKEDIGDAP